MGFSKEDLRAMTVKVTKKAAIEQIRKHLEKLGRKNDSKKLQRKSK